MAKASELKGNEPIATTLGRETVFSGTMRFTSSLKIDGNFEGEIESSGSLFVEEGAQVRANIRVGSVVIGGVVHGNIVATKKLEMLSTGRVYGNVTTSKLKIADGVVFEGKCEMIRDPDDVDIFASSVGKIKDSLQTV
jgi:cytoskeletal protein CcmA (bactofilin family)